ncbi:hypothetical protein ACLB2K_077352 [Fragaria x ananassa]
MILHTTFSAPCLFSSCSSYRALRLHPFLSPKRRPSATPRLFTGHSSLSIANHHFLLSSSSSSPLLVPFSVAAAENGVFTSPQTSKSFDFANEERIYSWWESQGYFRPNFDRGTDPFVISMPPPNVTGSLHMGHAMFVTLEDIMVRYHRMKGRPTLWVPGTDHAGIATQLVVERMLASEGIKRVDLGREEFVKRVWEWKEKPVLVRTSTLGLKCGRPSVLHRIALTTVRFHPSGLQQFSRSFSIPGESAEFQFYNEITQNFKSNRSRRKIGIRRIRWGGKVIGDAAGVRWGGGAPSSEPSGGEQRDIRTLSQVRTYGGTITNQIKRLGASCDWKREHFTLDEQLSRKAFFYLVELQTDFLTIATTRPETLFGDVAIAVHPEDDRYSKYINRMAIVPMTYGRHVPIIADKLVEKEFGTGVLKISPGHDHNDYNLARKLGLPILNVMNKDGTLNKVAGLYCGLDRFEARKKLWADLEETGLAVKKEPHTLRVPRSQRGGEVIEPLVSKQWFVTMEPLAEKALQAVEKGDLKLIPERFDKIYNHWLSNIKDWCISRQLWWGHRIPVWYIVGKDCEEEYIVARSFEEALGKAQEKYGRDAKIYQDPDVLDTWFSSALWPFSTLGWPDESTEDFRRFYPTSMLETGHDILFFWVARMVMMGIEFTGTVPFSHIYLHGLIRDPEGRKMSKTLGNVIDPLDTIKEYGTDALRFTLALGTAGQDLNLSTERLTSNKAFTNKLWNAGKFVLQNLPSQNDASWESILTYIEASKARLSQSGSVSEASVAQAVLLYVFENILKLLHPFMPFVTEELWQALPNRKEALIASPWPLTSLPRQIISIKKFENLQALTRAIRNARAEYSVEPVKRISASIVANAEVTEYIMVMNADQSVHLVAGEGLEAYLPLADMVDITSEIQRLHKRLSKMQTEYDGLIARLNSPKFKEKAPEDIVRGVQEKAAEAEEKITLTKNRLALLESTALVT